MELAHTVRPALSKLPHLIPSSLSTVLLDQWQGVERAMMFGGNAPPRRTRGIESGVVVGMGPHAEEPLAEIGRTRRGDVVRDELPPPDVRSKPRLTPVLKPRAWLPAPASRPGGRGYEACSRPPTTASHVGRVLRAPYGVRPTLVEPTRGSSRTR